MSTATRTGSVRRRHARNCASHDGARCRCSGTWQYRARTPNGERIEQAGFPTKAAADAALRDLLREVDRGTYRRMEAIAFDEYEAAWIAHVRPTLRPSTAASYGQITRSHLKPYFGSMMVGAITASHVRGFVAAKSAARKDDGSPVWRAATVRNMLTVMKLILGAAVEDGHAAINAAARVKPPRIERVEREILTKAELGRALAVAGDPWALLFDLLSWTTLRRGEALALCWDAIDLPAARIHVRASRGRWGEGQPKSAAGRRIVPITPAMVAALRRHHLAQAPDASESGGRVFRSATGGPIDGDNCGRAWTRALRKAGVRHVSIHSLRHFAISRMISAGASPKAVQAVGGHASIALTYDVYGHMFPGDLDQLALGLAALEAAAGDTAGDTEHIEGFAN